MHICLFTALFSVCESLDNIKCPPDHILMSSLSDLLYEYAFIRNIYLVINDDNDCDPGFEAVFGEHGISFEVYGFSSFNQRDFYGTQYLKQNLLIIYGSFQTKKISGRYLNKTLLESFSTILHVSKTKQVSQEVLNSKFLLLHPSDVNETVLWHIRNARWTIGGMWSSHMGWNFPSKDSISSVTMNNRQLKVATLPGFQFSVRHVVNGTVIYSGLYINYLDILAQTLNFTFIIVEPEDFHFGSDFDGDGQWNGIIGMVQRREADIGLSAFTQTAERRKVVDYLEYFTHSGLGMLMKRPENAMAFEFLAAFKPFKPEVWAAIASAVILASLVLWFLIGMEGFIVEGISTCKYLNLSSYRNHLRFFTEAVFGQEGDFPGTQSIPSRCFIVAVLFTFMFLRFTYMGHLISYLTVPKQQLPANTLKELAEQETHKVGILKFSSHEILFRTAKSGYFRVIWNKIQSNPGNLVVGIEDGIVKVKNENFIYVTEDLVVKLLVSNDCELVRGQEIFLPRYLGPIARKNWPFTTLFNKYIVRLREAGVLDHLLKKYFTNRSCWKDNSAIQLGLGSFKAVFTFWGGGCFLASVVLLLEKCCCRQKRK